MTNLGCCKHACYSISLYEIVVVRKCNKCVFFSPFSRFGGSKGERSALELQYFIILTNKYSWVMNN